MNEIAEKLKALRLENSLNLKELAVKAGCTGLSLTALEGHANSSIMTLKKIASALRWQDLQALFLPR